MSEFRREWKPCKVCSKYYDYSCNEGLKNCKKFIPENSFRNFLVLNNYDIINISNDIGKIYLVDDNINIVDVDFEKEVLDLRNTHIDKIKEILMYGADSCHVFILSINESIRDFLYFNDYIMSHYDIKMILSTNIKKTLKYRLDQRFNYIEFKDD